jgi:AraC-like DNA-binding protein
VFRAGNPANLLIKTAVEVIYAQLPDTDASDALALMTGICGMLKGILSKERPPEGSQAAFEKLRAQSIQRYILENLMDPDLNTEALTGRFAASRATIYRAFEPFGGVARYISEHRLERAKWELMTGNGKRGVVRAIAEKYGCHDTGNFNRAFRRKFNASPRELMGDVITSQAGNTIAAAILDPESHDILKLSDFIRAWLPSMNHRFKPWRKPGFFHFRILFGSRLRRHDSKVETRVQ